MTRALREAAQALELETDIRLIVLAAEGKAFNVGGESSSVARSTCSRRTV